ncbi:MAG TPA: methionyl-tRNA formyltransferase [Candidatus Saccharimonadales bacterium]|nr:methionyl-tRNA formyltransferase [Candidatus Saccharimonadales bacterium]
MQKRSETIVFFGSGPVAAESLRKLAQDFNIEAVVTKPKPPHHKYDFPVLSVAQELGLNILTTKDRANLESSFSNSRLSSRLGVVIDYGIIISKEVIDAFPLGIVNSHFSLLPKWRGADPITFSILKGDNETGVSLMLIDETLDTGPLLAQQSIPISADEDSIKLTNKLINLSHEMLSEYIPAYFNGEIKPQPQPEDGVSYSRKLTRKDGVLDFTKTALELERQVRAFIEWPRSRTEIYETDVIINAAHAIESDKHPPGNVWHHNKQLGFYTADGILVIDSLIPAGRKEMSTEDFVNGYNIT